MCVEKGGGGGNRGKFVNRPHTLRNPLSGACMHIAIHQANDRTGSRVPYNDRTGSRV